VRAECRCRLGRSLVLPSQSFPVHIGKASLRASRVAMPAQTEPRPPVENAAGHAGRNITSNAGRTTSYRGPRRWGIAGAGDCVAWPAPGGLGAAWAGVASCNGGSAGAVAVGAVLVADVPFGTSSIVGV
jgi:hypothetical protein